MNTISYRKPYSREYTHWVAAEEFCAERKIDLALLDRWIAHGRLDVDVINGTRVVPLKYADRVLESYRFHSVQK